MATHCPSEGMRQACQQPVEGRIAPLATLQLAAVTGDRRERQQLDERFEQVERVVVPRAAVLGVVRPAIELRQRQRQANEILAAKFHPSTLVGCTRSKTPVRF